MQWIKWPYIFTMWTEKMWCVVRQVATKVCWDDCWTGTWYVVHETSFACVGCLVGWDQGGCASPLSDSTSYGNIKSGWKCTPFQFCAEIYSSHSFIRSRSKMFVGSIQSLDWFDDSILQFFNPRILNTLGSDLVRLLKEWKLCLKFEVSWCVVSIKKSLIKFSRLEGGEYWMRRKTKAEKFQKIIIPLFKGIE